MIRYIQIDKPMKQIEGIECDVCHRYYEWHPSDMEIQEFVNINATAGYASVFGDMAEMRCNICQYCVKKLLGPYIRIVGPDDD